MVCRMALQTCGCGGSDGQGFSSRAGALIVCGRTLQRVRPFLGPLFACNSVLRPKKFAKFPLAVLLVLRIIQKKISRCPMIPMQVVKCITVEEGDFFRVDAKPTKRVE